MLVRSWQVQQLQPTGPNRDMDSCIVRYPGVAEARDQGCDRECLDISNAGDTQASLRSFQESLKLKLFS